MNNARRVRIAQELQEMLKLRSAAWEAIANLVGIQLGINQHGTPSDREFAAIAAR